MDVDEVIARWTPGRVRAKGRTAFMMNLRAVTRRWICGGLSPNAPSTAFGELR